MRHSHRLLLGVAMVALLLTASSLTGVGTTHATPTVTIDKQAQLGPKVVEQDGGEAGTPGGAQDFVVGGGQHSVPNTISAISVHSGPTGEAPSGHFSFMSQGAGPMIDANATCLIVTGNDAIATGIITHPDELAGQVVVMEAVDNGPPGGQPTDLLRFSFAGSIYPISPNCDRPVLAPIPITQGNIVVHDADAP